MSQSIPGDAASALVQNPAASAVTQRTLEWFRAQAGQAGGASYQTMIDDALRRVMEGRAESVEAALRRVIREELPKLRKASSG